MYPLNSQLKEVVLCAGELDALALITLGYNALTTTGSESSFPKKLAKQMRDIGIRKVRVLLDADITGIGGTHLRLNRLEEAGIEATGVFWDAEKPRGWDVTDEILLTGKVGVLE